MSQSLSRVYIHLTFGTKHRYPFIKTPIGEKLHPYISGIMKNMESPALVINSVPDHIHILFRQSKNYALSKIVEEIKKSSSRWIKSLDGGSSKFAWQDGYGAFSISSSAVENVRTYIENQQEHHRKRSFRQEVEEFLKQYDVEEYNPDYFWD